MLQLPQVHFRSRRRVFGTWTAAFVLLGAACAGSTEPRDATPAAIAAASGEQLLGVVGEELPQPVVVRVTNSAGEPAAGALVDFRVTAGAGTVRLGAAQTDEQGLARDYWTLGRTAGATQTLEARIVDPAGVRSTLSVSVQATARAAAPERLSIMTFLPSSATVSATLSTPVSVLVSDRYANRIAGAAVRFTPAAGSGMVSPAVAVTSADGTANGTWTLGPTAGLHSLTVSIDGSTASTARFTVSVNAIDLSGVVLFDNLFRKLGNNTGTRRAELVVGDTLHFNAIVRNAQGQAVSGVPVTWALVDGSAVARVDASGFTEALATGSARIVARSGALVSDTVALAVLPPLRAANVEVDGSTICASPATGGIACWNPPAVTPPPVPGSSAIRTAISRFIDPCGLDAGGRFLCVSPGGTVTPLAGGVSFTAVSTLWGFHHCGIAADGRGYCWGNGRYGRLGNGDTLSSAAPVEVAGNHVFTSISAGYDFSCGVDTAGVAWCWGDNAGGSLGQTTITVNAACTNPNSQLGCSLVPVQVSGTTRFRSVSAGNRFACGVTTTGTVACWGEGRLGATGMGVAAIQVTPAAIAGGGPYTMVSSGSSHACGLREDALVECWGKDSYAGTLRADWLPSPVVGGYRFTSVSAGFVTTCGLSEGRVLCWGFGFGPNPPAPSPWSPLDRLGPLQIAAPTP